MKYCKHRIDLLLLCDNGALQLIIFQVERFHEVRICSLQVASGCSLLVVGCFRLFLIHGRLFHVVSCLLQVIPGCFLLVEGFRFFLAHCRSFQVVLGHFRSFHILVSTSLCMHTRIIF